MNKGVILALVTAVFLVFSIVCGVSAQTVYLELESNNVRKSSFHRGEEITVVVTIPYSATVEVWLHFPPGTAGPPSVLFIPSTTVSANVETRLGPGRLPEGAPCGKYQIEVRTRTPAGTSSFYRFFDYAMNEPPCIGLPPPPPSPDWGMILMASIAAIVAVVGALTYVLLRQRPPKARGEVVIPPPVQPPTTPPKPSGVRRAPYVRKAEEERGE